ncbi:hypothetical protein IMSHALPRED_000735 [Imshaugia aleurites]|uniref:Heterokaryon incompatibility domain-containing protein n=1 Tax=Imshaugia aleurites TaxID=172621 RepID=A0A8H3G7G2_9LECA|nr:hypothetical protein IMSHALPRED_000735 [Imshaugia aleurites]
MTLSHCWGTAEFLRLTSATKNYLEAGFRLSELPKTFREAVQITRELGVRYLWIDALCIIQDSDEDWKHEAATMMNVYENSHCNIAAAKASDSEQGCFSKRDPLSIAPIVVRTEWNNTNKRSYHVHPELWRTYVEECPLNQRAWVIQERTLAPRILHYGRDQLFWECFELSACETYPNGLPQRPHEKNTRYFDLDKAISRRTSRALLPEQKLPIYEYWQRIVSTYSACNLTRAEDRLVAISGLAKRIQLSLGDEYLAGLWQDILTSDLLWYVKWLDRKQKTRPTFYRAPSWSWASVNDGVSFAQDKISVLTVPLITILAADVDLATADATGQVTNGFICLSGSLMPIIVKNHSSIHSTAFQVPENVRILAYFDVETKYGQAGIFFLPILNDTGEIWGLMLELVDPTDNKYNRLGALEIATFESVSFDHRQLMETFERVEKQTLTLI